MKSFVLIFFVLTSCQKNMVRQFANLETNRIDTSRYNLINQKFSPDKIKRAPDYLGGLKPDYPITMLYTDCNKCLEEDWKSKGMMCSCKGFLIESPDSMKWINKKEGLRLQYAPVESVEEALSYAILLTGYFPVFSKDYFKKTYSYFIKDPETTYVQPFKDHYLVQLYDYKLFGCGEHPYFSVQVKVHKNGEISELKKEKAFKNPEEDVLCVD